MGNGLSHCFQAKDCGKQIRTVKEMIFQVRIFFQSQMGLEYSFYARSEMERCFKEFRLFRRRGGFGYPGVQAAETPCDNHLMNSRIVQKKTDKTLNTFSAGNGLYTHFSQIFHASHLCSHTLIPPDTVGNGQAVGARMICRKTTEDQIKSFVGKSIPGISRHPCYSDNR